jgi:hypothetical protein
MAMRPSRKRQPLPKPAYLSIFTGLPNKSVTLELAQGMYLLAKFFEALPAPQVG